MSKKGVCKKVLSLFVIFLFLFVGVVPKESNAAPEAYAFEDYSKVNNVNLYTGDTSLGLPLFSIPVPGGEDYPLVLNYHSGIKLDQQASWVGLGWDVGVDSVRRKVNMVPDDSLPSVDNYKIESNYPSKYPTSKYKEQLDQTRQAQSKNRWNMAVGLAFTVGSAALTGGASFAVSSAAAAEGAIMTPFAASLVSTGIQSGMNEANFGDTFEDVEKNYKSVKESIDLRSNNFESKPVDGFLFSDTIDIINDGAESVDYQSPDEYFVSSNVYSGSLSLIRDETNSHEEAFIPSSYRGVLDEDSGMGNDVSISGEKGYLKTYNNVMLTDSALRIITDVDSAGATSQDGSNIKGFEFVDVSGKHYIIDEEIENYVSSSLSGFLPSQESNHVGSFSEFTYTNRFPGDIGGENFPTLLDEDSWSWINLYSDSQGKYGSAHYLLGDYTSLWGISAILGPTFDDMEPSGEVNYPDKGEWIKFNYGSPSLSDEVYTISNSKKVSTDNVEYYDFDNSFGVTSDGKKFISRSFKDYSYLESIETATHVVDFIVDFNRNDASEVYSTGSLDKMPKLNSVVLKMRDYENDPAVDFIELEKYDFVYDHSLAYGAPDNILVNYEGECSSGDWRNCGRLTLLSLTHSTCDDWDTGGFCEDNGWNPLPSIEFEYASGDEPVLENVCSGNYLHKSRVSNSCYGDFSSSTSCNNIEGCSWNNCFASSSENCEEYCSGNYYRFEGSSQSASNLDLLNCVLKGGSINENLVTTNNPKYVDNAFDRWGYYFLSTSVGNIHNHAGLYHNSLPEAWSLTKVTWPTGGTTEWSYESDRYNRVNDYYPDAWGNMEKDDTHYGGGIRVKTLKNCDGFGGCYETNYRYDNREIHQSLVDPESDGWNSETSGETSGFVLGEPAFPTYLEYGLIGRFSNKYENNVIKTGIPSHGYSRVLEFGAVPEEKGVVEHKFTTPLDGGFAGTGAYVAEKIFRNYDPDGDSDAKGSNPSSEVHSVGGPFVIKEGIGDDDINDLMITEGETYLVQSDEPGYLFFFRTKAKTHSGGCSSVGYSPYCHAAVKLHHAYASDAKIDQPCPGDANSNCGSITLTDRGDPSDGSWGDDCGCKDHGDRLYFCLKSEVDSAVEGSEPTISEIEDGLGDNEGWDVEGCNIGGYDCTNTISWTFPWDDFCWSIYGGYQTSEDWDYTSTVNTNPCVDENNNKECDLLENNINLNKNIPVYKYGLEKETNAYGGQNLQGNPVSYNIREYSFPFINEYGRGTIMTGSPYLTSETSKVDSKEITITYPTTEIDDQSGMPKVTKTQNSDGSWRRTEISLAREYGNDDYSFGRDDWHILSSPKMTTVNEGSTLGDGSVVQATNVDYNTFFTSGSKSGLYLPWKTYSWKDGNDDGNVNTGIDDFNQEWKIESEIISYDDKFVRPDEVKDAKGESSYSYFTNSGDGECSGSTGVYLTCVENALGHQTKTYYDSLGRISYIEDPNGLKNQYSYDSLGRIEKVLLPGNNNFENPDNMYDYNFYEGASSPNWVKMSTKLNDNEEAVSINFFDGLGRPIQTKNRLNEDDWLVGITEYDERGLVEQTYRSRIVDTNEDYDLSFDKILISAMEYFRNPSLRVKKIFLESV